MNKDIIKRNYYLRNNINKNIIKDKDNIIIEDKDNIIIENKDDIIIEDKDNIIIENKDNIKYFITFGAGGQNYIDAGNRLINQVNNTELFDKTILYTDIDLKNDPEFWNKHSNFILKNKKGFGYWLWKPYIIKKTIAQMKDGDILLYLDAGCEIDIKKKEEIQKYFEYVKKDFIIGTYTKNDEYKLTKMDLILRLNLNDKKYTNSKQHQAGVVMYLINNNIRNLINEWYKIACNYHFIDDTKSIKKNHNLFWTHKHDQSIFSLLRKKYNFNSKYSLKDLVLICQNRSGISNIIVENKDNIIVENKDNIIVENKDNIIVENKDNIIVENKDNIIVENKDNIIVENKDNNKF